MSKTIKVVIVDDHAMVREGLKKMLSTEEDLSVVGEAGDGMDAIALGTRLKPDVVVLDISMPGMGGLEIVPVLLEKIPDVRIVMLSMHGKETLAQEALRAGASAYILKGDCGDELLTAIRTVARGEYYFSAQLRAALVSSYIGGAKPALSEEEKLYRTLSEREQQYFRLMLQGKSTTEISQMLGISCKTGQKHRTSVVKKLGTSNPMELIKLAVKVGLFEPDFLQDA